MKKFLLFACCFLFSCATIEPVPEATKLEIQNSSGMPLLNVKWRGIDFGTLQSGERSERRVPEGNDFVFFDAENGKQYRTQTLIQSLKHRNNSFTFIYQTPIVNSSNLSEAGGLGDLLQNGD
jgi:hypothetical protein